MYRDYQNTIKIPVRVKNGVIQNYYGGPTLNDVKCYIPALNKDAVSLNNAYMIISQELETERKSHTGNVFKHGYIRENNYYINLETIRTEFQAQYNRTLYLSWSIYILEDRYYANDIDIEADCLVKYLLENKYIRGFKINKFYKSNTYEELINKIDWLLDKKIIAIVD